MVDPQIVMRIAQKVKAARLQKGYTLQRLSELTRLSKSLLSKVENSRTIPSLPVLINVIQNLQLPLSEFFNDMNELNGKNYIHLKNHEYLKVDKEGRLGFNYFHILSQTLSPNLMEVSLLIIEPGTSGLPSSADGFEFKYIISGQCEYYLDNTMIRLEKGDSLFFDATRPHVPVNHFSENVVMLVIYFLN